MLMDTQCINFVLVIRMCEFAVTIYRLSRYLNIRSNIIPLTGGKIKTLKHKATY